MSEMIPAVWWLQVFELSKGNEAPELQVFESFIIHYPPLKIKQKQTHITGVAINCRQGNTQSILQSEETIANLC